MNYVTKPHSPDQAFVKVGSKTTHNIRSEETLFHHQYTDPLAKAVRVENMYGKIGFD